MQPIRSGFPRCSARFFLALLFALAFATASSYATDSIDVMASGSGLRLAKVRPAVLVHAPRPSVDRWGGWVDLRYLRELREAGIDVDYTDTHRAVSYTHLRAHET